MSEVSCTSKPLHVAAYVVYDLGGCVILGIARLIIAGFGYAYYSCCSSGAKLSQRAKVKAENGDSVGAFFTRAKGFFDRTKDKVESQLNDQPTAAEAKKIFTNQAWRGLMEVTIVGAWWLTWRDTSDPKGGLFGLSTLEKGFDRLQGDMATTN